MSEQQQHRSILKSSMGVVIANLLSRILGFVRIILEANVLGGGVYKAAWVLAFTIANIFRRILGEGALAQALVPMMSSTLEKSGPEESRKQLNAIFFWLSLLLAAISVITALTSIVAGHFVSSEHAILACRLIPLLSPYIFLMCLVGIFGSILNTFRVYFLPALGALFLNIFMIAVMLIVPYVTGDGVTVLKWFSYAVLVSGIVEFIMMLMLMKWKKILPDFHWLDIRNYQVIRELWRLALPGVIGASAYQVSVVVDRFLASYLGAQAVSALEYSERLVYFPVGVFAVSVSGVLLTEMSRAVGRGDMEGMLAQLRLGLRHIYFLAIPTAAFMIIFRTEILERLLLHGRFTASDLNETAYAMFFYSFGIPLFCSFKVIVNTFYSRKDMKTPVMVSICVIILNIVLNLILMQYMRQGGIALATVISSFANNFVLLLILRRKLGHSLQMKPVYVSMIRITLVAVAAGVGGHLLYPFMTRFTVLGGIVPLIGAIVLFGVFYLGLAFACRCTELTELLGTVSRRFHKSKP